MWKNTNKVALWLTKATSQCHEQHIMLLFEEWEMKLQCVEQATIHNLIINNPCRNVTILKCEKQHFKLKRTNDVTIWWARNDNAISKIINVIMDWTRFFTFAYI